MPDRSRNHQRSDLDSFVSAATNDDQSVPADHAKDPAAVALGRKGGLKGGKARAAKLTQEQRTEIARKAAMARWQRPEA